MQYQWINYCLFFPFFFFFFYCKVSSVARLLQGNLRQHIWAHTQTHAHTHTHKHMGAVPHTGQSRARAHAPLLFPRGNASDERMHARLWPTCMPRAPTNTYALFSSVRLLSLVIMSRALQRGHLYSEHLDLCMWEAVLLWERRRCKGWNRALGKYTEITTQSDVSFRCEKGKQKGSPPAGVSQSCRLNTEKSHRFWRWHVRVGCLRLGRGLTVRTAWTHINIPKINRKGREND